MAKDDEPLEPEVINPSGSPSNRVRAYRIRNALKKGEQLSAEDADWIRRYENERKDRGASRTHKVQFTEESAEAEGTGDAASIAAAMAAPQLAKEEGRRYDSLILAAVSSMTAAGKQTQAAYDMVLRMGAQLLERNNQMETVHLSMLETIRQGHLARTEAEAELIRSEAEADAAQATDGPGGIDGMVKDLMPVIISELAKRTKPTPGKT